MDSRNFLSLIGVILCTFALVLSVHLPFSERMQSPGISTDGPAPSIPPSGCRYINRFEDEFNTTDNIDFGNTTCSVDVGAGRVYIAGLYEEDFDGGLHGFRRSTHNGANHIVKLASGAENHLTAIGSQGNCLYIYDNDGRRDTRCLYTVRLGPLKNSRPYTFQAKVCLIAMRGGGIFSPGGHAKVHLIRDNGQFSAEETFWSQAAPNNVPGGTTVHGRTTLNRQFTPNYDDSYLLGLELWSHDGSNDRAGIQIDDIKIIGEGVALEPMSFIQSKPVYTELPTIGAAKMTWFESTPPGTNIIYNMTVDGEHWVTAQNGTNHIFEHRGSWLMWNATLTTDSEDRAPYIERIVIEYDLFSDPEPHSPPSSEWQGTSTPTLEWNFTDPDQGDGQSACMTEVYGNEGMNELLYESGWVESVREKHTIGEALPDGSYYWRVKTRDDFEVGSNFSKVKKIMIDITKPNGSIVIEEGAPSVNEMLVDLAINATDNGSGVSSMQIINDQGDDGPWEDYSEEKVVVLTKTDGNKVIGVRFRDHAGIVSDVFNDSVYFDLLGPGTAVITSSTHPDPATYYNSTSPVFEWDPPCEVTGIQGYSYLVDQSRLSEPGKVLYNMNGDISGTSPGEFTGLGDGTWHFHLTSCDNYGQWGNTSHFHINIDTTEPLIALDSPEESTWLGTSTVQAGAVFEDPDGFGIDVETIQYSYRAHGEAFSPWTRQDMEFEVLKKGIADNPEKVRAQVGLDLSEGDGNAVRWRVGDLASNGPVGSELRYIRIDVSGVYFLMPEPEEGEVHTEETVSCGITISDNGSGVDGKTIEYSVSEWGDDDPLFENWIAAGNRMVTDTITVLVDVKFSPGSDNYIRWRARDAVGNDHAVSEPVNVRVNSAPVPVLASPCKWAIIEADSPFELNASGTSDENGDVLNYYWEIKNKTTKRVVLSGSGISREASLRTAGKYVVCLFVDDGYGFNVSETVTIEVTPASGGGPGGTPGSGSGGGGDTTGEEDKKTGSDLFMDHLWVFLAAGVMLILLSILTFVLIARRRKRSGNGKAAPGPMPHRSPPGIPYATGGYGHGVRPGAGPYSAPPGGPPYGAVPQPQYRPPPGTGTGMNRPPSVYYPPPSYLKRPALPPGPVPPFFKAPGGANISNLSELPALPQPGGGVAPDSGSDFSEPQFTLPPLITDQGLQDLNLMALPPAPEQVSSQEPIGEIPAQLDITAHQDMPVPPSAPTPPPTFTPSLFPVPSASPCGASAPGPTPAAGSPNPFAYQCYSCKSMNKVNDAARPLMVTCGVCGTQSLLDR